MTTCRTPIPSAAARCSSARLRASSAGVSERSAVPAPPLVHSTYVTSQPAATHLATTPPDPISASSGWAKTTIARSGTAVTISSFGAVGSTGMEEILSRAASCAAFLRGQWADRRRVAADADSGADRDDAPARGIVCHGLEERAARLDDVLDLLAEECPAPDDTGHHHFARDGLHRLGYQAERLRAEDQQEPLAGGVAIVGPYGDRRAPQLDRDPAVRRPEHPDLDEVHAADELGH